MLYKNAYKQLCSLSATFLLIFLLSANFYGAPGSLDFSFGNGGIVVTSITNFPYYDSPTTMQVQPDGKIVVCGDITAPGEDGDYLTSFFIARYNQNGTLDASFGANGKIIVPVVHFNGDYAGRDIALQPDGKIVAVGFRYDLPAGVRAVVHRYNPDGTLDASFGAGGKVVTQVGVFALFTSRVAVQPDGKILVAGSVSLTQSTYEDNAFAVVRFNPNGTLDASFGAGGITIIAFAGNSEVQVSAVLLQPNGRIVVVGGNRVRGTIYGFALIRYNADGSLDSGFGSNGKVFHIIDGWESLARDGVLQPDGKIVAAGHARGDQVIVRYNADGSIDTSFAANGIFRMENGSGFYAGISLALQPNGKIVGFGYGANAVVTSFAALRLNPDGSPDAGFGTNGRVTTQIGTNSKAIAGALQPDGKILAYGETSALDNSGNVALVRYLADSNTNIRTPFDFDGDSKTDISIFRPGPGEWWINRSLNGSTFALQFGAGTDTIAPADFTGDGKTDVAFFRPSTGQWFVLRSEDSSFYAFPFGTSGDVPVPADYDADGKADAAVFRPSTLTWFIAKSTGGTDIIGFGSAGDVPTVADYDGDAKADIAIYRPNAAGGAQWWVRRSSTASVFALQFGTPTDRTVQGDYTGDGKADIAFWRPSTGGWFVLRSEDFSFFSFPFGTNGDIPVPGDYDGDGRNDAAVFRPSTSTWFAQRGTGGTLIQQFGIAGDLPLPSAFVR